MTLRPTAQALYHGLVANMAAAQEHRAEQLDQLNQFHGFAYPAGQAMELFAAWHPAMEAWEAAGNAPIVVSNLQRAVLNLTPILAFLVIEAIPNETVQNVFRWGQHQLGRMLRVAFTVSYVAIYYFNGSPFALLALGVQAVGFLEQSRLLPRKISKLLSTAEPIVFNTTMVVLWGLRDFWGLYAACRLASPAIEYAWTSAIKPFLLKQIPVLEERDQQLQLGENLARAAAENRARIPTGKLEQIPNPDAGFLVDVDHLRKGSLPWLSNADPEDLLDIWDDLNDPRLTPTLRQALENQLATWKTWNPRQNIEARYLQHIVAELPQKETNLQVQILVQLANAQLQEADIHNAFSKVFGHGDVLPVHLRIYHRLQEYRTQRYFSRSTDSGWLARFETWRQHHELMEVAPLGLAHGSPEDRDLKNEDLQLIGYGHSLNTLVHDEEVAWWRAQQSNEVQNALASKTNEECKPYMLMSYGILKAKVQA